MIDMEIVSEPPTRPASPKLPVANGTPIIPDSVEKINGEGDLIARKVGIGSLFKSAKQDINVPEFDMGAFF